MSSAQLTVSKFAQIEEVSIEFGHLTVLVGPQASGKSLALQWLKFALDGREVVSALAEAGHSTKDRDILLDLLFGSGMSAGWRDGETKIRFRDVGQRSVDLSPSDLRRRGRRDGKGRVFYIPAHRALLMSDGWAAPFQRLSADTPVVARLFSQHVFEHFSTRRGGNLFPVAKKLKAEYKNAIDEAVFHGGQVGIEMDAVRHARRIFLKFGHMQIPYMTWTAGQREFTPLMLGLYALLPSTQKRRDEVVEWVIIEEPEMGLHPKALNAVFMLILDLLWRGYRVVLSTHSPDVLTAVWMLQRLKENQADWKLVLEGFGLPVRKSLKDLAESALKRDYRVYSLHFGGQTVRSQDISDLDVGSDDQRTREWGDVIAFSSRYGDVVAKAVTARGDR